MEPVNTSGLSGGLSTASLGEKENSLDNVVRELASNKPEQRYDDDRQDDAANEISLTPVLAHTLPPALLAVRAGKIASHRLSKGQPSVSQATMTQPKESRTEGLASGLSSARGVVDPTKTLSLFTAQANVASSSALAPSPLSAEFSSIASGTSMLAKTDTNRVTVRTVARTDGRGFEILSATGSESLPTLSISGLAIQKDTREKRVREDGAGAAGLQTSLASRETALRPHGEQKMNRSSPSSFAAQSAEVPVKQPNGLTYRFTRWGAEHTVTVQGTTGGNLLLQPSDSVVTQQLSEQWQSGHPQKWQLVRDEGEERNPHQQQHEDE
ncbi:MAG: type III secretion system needle length determinant, SpaN/EivJ family [Plesiomonas shigelloides]